MTFFHSPAVHISDHPLKGSRYAIFIAQLAYKCFCKTHPIIFPRCCNIYKFNFLAFPDYEKKKMEMNVNENLKLENETQNQKAR